MWCSRIKTKKHHGAKLLKNLYSSLLKENVYRFCYTVSEHVRSKKLILDDSTLSSTVRSTAMRLNNSNWYLLYELCVSSVIWSLLCVPSVLWRCWIGGRKGIWPVKTEWWGTGVVSVRSEVQMICTWSSWCHCHPIISCCSKIQNGLPFWCRLTRLSWKKGRLNRCNGSSIRKGKYTLW